MPAPPQHAEILRAFRRNAVHVRHALRVVREAEQQTVRVVDGYIQDPAWLDRYRRLSTPVRRAAMENDKASLRRAMAALEASESGGDVLARARAVFADLQAELDSTVGLGGRKVSRGEMFRAWMDAAVFYDSSDKQQPYEALLSAHGKAIESLSADLTERFAEAVLAADEAAAEALGEPVILPPPEKTPPPPPDPKEKGRWKQVLVSLFRSKKEDDD